MKKTFTLINSLSSSNDEINNLLDQYKDGLTDEDTLISNVILILSTEKYNADENDDDIKRDLMIW